MHLVENVVLVHVAAVHEQLEERAGAIDVNALELARLRKEQKE